MHNVIIFCTTDSKLTSVDFTVIAVICWQLSLMHYWHHQWTEPLWFAHTIAQLRVLQCILSIFVFDIFIQLVAWYSSTHPCRYDVHECCPKSRPSHSSLFVFCIPSPQYAFRQTAASTSLVASLRVVRLWYKGDVGRPKHCVVLLFAINFVKIGILDGIHPHAP